MSAFQKEANLTEFFLNLGGCVMFKIVRGVFINQLMDFRTNF